MNLLIRLSLKHRLLVLVAAVIALVGGGKLIASLPIDIFPNLTRPRVTLMTECAGLSPEEVETLVTIPLETALNGASGVESVRSTSGVGLSAIYVEFDWRTEIYRARQIVNERIASVTERLPKGVTPELAPVSSMMGQILIVGLYSRSGETSPLDVRLLADWTIRPRLLSIPGIAQVVTMGGGRKQFQVVVEPERLIAKGVTLRDVESAVRDSNQNASGGYLTQGGREYLVRSLGRITSLGDLRQTVVRSDVDRTVTLNDVATVREAAQPKRGDSSVNGRPSVVLTISKQPDSDTRRLTELVHEALHDVQRSLPGDVVIESELFQQRDFIERGIDNVMEALRDGAILIVIVLLLFLMNVRTTIITLTAIPLSIVLTGIVFWLSGMSINVMTLGGLAVAMGELVDDAIVDIENVFRRLAQNAALAQPRAILDVVYDASREVRSSIVFGTMLVILVFLPLFALSGVEGRLFIPLGVAYIVSILASLLVSLTVTPVLGSLLLSGRGAGGHAHQDGPLLRAMKWLARYVLAWSLSRVGLFVGLAGVTAAMVASVIGVAALGTDFLPKFNEGTAQVNIVLPPGSALETSNSVSAMFDQALRKYLATDEQPTALIKSWVRRSGRAELDEHAEGVHITEVIITLNPKSPLPRSEALATLRAELERIPGIESEVEQPLSHNMSHMLSGVSAQIAIKLFGDDLDVLRRKAEEIRQAIRETPGLAPPVVEPQQLIPQLRIELDRERLASYGLTVAEVNEFLETALQGRVVTTVLDGAKTFDLVVRFDEQYRADQMQLSRLPLQLAGGGRVPLSAVARIYDAAGPGTISRENARRRITIRCNATDRDLGSVVADIRQRIEEDVSLPPGYFVIFGGQFESQQEATRTILVLSAVSLVGIFVVLFTLFPSTRIVLQILLALPIAFIGGVAALWLTGQTLSVASLVGFISLGGIAARNGILLVAHYLHLMREEGEQFTREMVVRGSLERLAPVLMTALTAGIGLVPLVLGGHQPGKEILYPVATVILGGLVTSTACEYLIHPGLFFRFSGQAAIRLAAQKDAEH